MRPMAAFVPESFAFQTAALKRCGLFVVKKLRKNVLRAPNHSILLSGSEVETGTARFRLSIKSVLFFGDE